MLRIIILDHSPNLEIVSIIPRLIFQGLFKPLRQFWILSRTRNLRRSTSVTTLDAASTIKSPFVCEIAEFFSTTQKLSLPSNANLLWIHQLLHTLFEFQSKKPESSISLSSAILKLSELGRTVQWDEVTERMCMCCTTLSRSTASATQGLCHTVALPFTLKNYLKAKQELWKLK
jgi:hypothetical protein